MSYKDLEGVCWCLPNTKKAFAYSTVATSDLITVLSEKFLTVQDVYNAINYDNEIIQIKVMMIMTMIINYLYGGINYGTNNTNESI